MIRLIVNADDLGAGAPTDCGILQAFRQGIVTSVSLLANGPSFAEAARIARSEGIPAGVHLNLAEYRSLTGPIAGLTSAAGEFPGKVGARRALAGGEVEVAALRRELTAQVDRVRQAGLEPDHLDTHQHCGLLAAVTPLLLAICRTSGIRAMRLPSPAEPVSADPEGLLGEEVALYRRLIAPVAAAVREAGIVTPDGLFGMPLLDRLDEPALHSLLREMPAGTWELMVHPGCSDPDRPFATPAREGELAALTSPGTRQLIDELGIRLITFGELACAS